MLRPNDLIDNIEKGAAIYVLVGAVSFSCLIAGTSLSAELECNDFLDVISVAG